MNSGRTRISPGGGDNSKDGIRIGSVDDGSETTCPLNAIATRDLFSESNRQYGI